jgi:GAF domain-containing protein
VTLVDADRQFYAACVGLPEPLAAARETPLDVSFCRLTVADAALGAPAGAARSRALLAIGDTRRDPRTRDMASVTDFGVHAYAGVALVVDGQPVGTLA